MVSISMNPTTVENTRSEYARKRSAEVAYSRHADYAGRNESKRSEVAQQLTHSKESMEAPATPPFTKLAAGQLKHVSLPLGETLEETINSWRNVRREAISTPDPSEADHQLAAAASAKIMEAEAQLALENRQRSIQLSEAKEEDHTREEQKVYEYAKSAYAFQTEARQRGYEVEHPAFSLSA